MQRGPLPPIPFGGDVMEKHRYGNSGVNFGPDGRIHSGGREATYPGRGREKSRKRPEEVYRDYRSDGGFARNNINRNMEKPRAPLDRRPQVYSIPPPRGDPRGDPTYKPHYALGGGPRPPVYPDNSLKRGWNDPMYDRSPDRSGLIPNRGRNRPRGRPPPLKIPWEFIFIVIGIVMLILGITNIIVCYEHHGYCRIWTGFLILEFGIFGLIHKGDYKKKWKNWDYIIFGILSVLGSFASTALVLSPLATEIKALSITNASLYVSGIEAMNKHGAVTLNSTADMVWVCLGVDGATIGFLMISYIALPMVLYTASKFYDTNWETTARCKPFCRPALFNPWIQPLFAQATIFMGIVCVFACEAHWKNYWSPVWAGVIVAIAGVVSGISRKRPDHDELSAASMVVQFLAMACCVAAIALCTLGMVKDITDLNSSTNLIDRRFLIASACLFAFTDFFLLVCVTYSLADMGRAFLSRTSFMRDRKDDRYSDRSYDSRSEVSSRGYNDDRRHNDDRRRPSPNRGDMYRGGAPPRDMPPARDMYRGGMPPLRGGRY